MAVELNKVIKTGYSPVKIEYTSKDYLTILDDLIASIPRNHTKMAK